MRSSVVIAALLALIIPTAVVAQDEVTVVPNDQFCNLVSDDLAACEDALSTLASAGMVPEAFEALLGGSVSGDSEAADEVADSEPDTTGNAGVGDSQSRDDVRVTVVKANWKPKVTNQFLTPDKGNKVVAVLVRYEALDDDASYNPLYWSAADREGFSYSASIVPAVDPGLKSGDLRKGKKTQGWVTFEVPNNVNWLEVSESQFFEDSLYWTVPKK